LELSVKKGLPCVCDNSDTRWPFSDAVQAVRLDTASAVVDSEDCKWPVEVAARDIDRDAVVARFALWARLEA
jgi:hypothetical protein